MRSIVAKAHPISHNGPVGKLLERLGRHHDPGRAPDDWKSLPFYTVDFDFVLDRD